MFTRKPLLNKALRRRVGINFFGGEGSMIGHLVEYDKDTYVLEQCETVPPPGEGARSLPGRHYIDRINCWLQELPT